MLASLLNHHSSFNDARSVIRLLRGYSITTLMRMTSNKSTIKLTHEIIDLPSKNAETSFKGRLYPKDKWKRKKQKHSDADLTIVTPELVDSTLNTLVPSSLLSLSSPKSCKHISNLCKQLITYTSSSYPTMLLERSANEYCKKRSNEIDIHPKNKLPNPISNSSSFRYLEVNDIVIAVGHCHDCNTHNMTLAHKEHEYIKYADEFIRQSVKDILELQLNVRVGVFRYPSDILGALEIQITSNSYDNGIQTETLHSKVMTKRWPSKSVFKKRLLSFINRQSFKGFKKSDSTFQQHNPDVYDGLASYPVGIVDSFEEVAFSNPSWSYEVVRKEATVAGRVVDSEYSEMIFDEVTDEGKLVNVIYAFDSRKVGIIQVGSIVEVADVSNPRGDSSERHPLIGEVLQIDDVFLSVKLKYFVANTTHHYSSVKLVSNRDVGSLDDIPVELEALFLLIREKVGQEFEVWRLIDESDKVVDGHKYLCRTSLFHQFRNLVYDIEHGNSSVSHPRSGALVDLQLCYCEKVLDWVFDCLGEDDSISMFKLELVILSGDIFAYDGEMKTPTYSTADITTIDNDTSDVNLIVSEKDVINALILEILESTELRNQIS